MALVLIVFGGFSSDYDKRVADEVNRPKPKLVKESVSTEEEVKLTYTDEELYLLSHLINGEAGCSWFSEEHRQLVGLVVLNRVKSDRFPNSLKEVIFQIGQYKCTWDGNFDVQPSEKSIESAKKVLSGDTIVECPENVVFQAEFKQGSGVYKSIYDKILNTTIYFCYM